MESAVAASLWWWLKPIQWLVLGEAWAQLGPLCFAFQPHTVLPHTHVEGEYGRMRGPNPFSDGQMEG